MLIILVTIVLILFLGWIFWQDLSQRLVSLWLLITVVLCALITKFLHQSLWMGLCQTAINLTLLGWLLLLLTVYVSVRSHKLTWPVGKWIGAGDLLFWLTPAIVLPPPRFILYWLASSVFALIAHWILRLIVTRYYRRDTYGESIPLAGLQALWLGAILLSQMNGSSVYYQ